MVARWHSQQTARVFQTPNTFPTPTRSLDTAQIDPDRSRWVQSALGFTGGITLSEVEKGEG